MNTKLLEDSIKINKENITNINNEIVNLNQTIVNLVYPVGAIFITTDNNLNNPTDIFPNTTWEQLPDDYYIRTSSTAKNTGGSDYITVEQLPQHIHPFVQGYTWQWTNHFTGEVTQSIESITHTGNLGINSLGTNWYTMDKTDIAGSGQAYYPRYYTVKAWKRLS